MVDNTKCGVYNRLTTEIQSPYQQKLANTHVVPIHGVSRRRPLSAASSRPERPRTTETCDDSGYGDDRPPRPTSAPLRRRSDKCFVLFFFCLKYMEVHASYFEVEVDDELIKALPVMPISVNLSDVELIEALPVMPISANLSDDELIEALNILPTSLNFSKRFLKAVSVEGSHKSCSFLHSVSHLIC